MDEITQQIINDYIIDGDNAIRGITFRQYLTIEFIEKLLEGE